MRSSLTITEPLFNTAAPPDRAASFDLAMSCFTAFLRHQPPAGVLLLVVLLGFSCALANGGDAPASASDTYRLYHPVSDVEAVLVLLPGFGGDVNSFDLSSNSTPSTLPTRLAAHGVLTVVAVPNSRTLYESEESIGALDALLSAIFEEYRIGSVPVAIGGFSAGGTGAVRYAQSCAENKCRAVSQIAAVFAVDAPLDFERLYHSSLLLSERAAPRSNVAEERMILQMLGTSLGGSPEEARPAYLKHSALVASAPDGGNARLLQSTPIRLYTEADVQWWMDERNLDFYGMNVVDHATLINLLRVSGNHAAELIITTGRGYRPNGQRHPHSWSIVDEAELAGWLRSTVSANQ
jgi:surfactin synthase thioesterase subunit